MTQPGVMSIVKDPDSTYSVLFEDDGKVAYAYLRDEDRVVADVWIYNCGEAPETAEWNLPDARSRLPFTNPRGFVRDEPRPVVRHPSDIGCRWINNSNGLVAVEVLINGMRFARLEPGSTPGWSRLASRDGPNAKPLSVTDRT